MEHISNSPQETLALGRTLGGQLRGSEIILMNGDLGAGKTLLTKGIASALGIDENNPVVSPSFTLVNIHPARLELVHVDLYRLCSDEIYDLGLDDYMDEQHVLVIEWADVGRDFFKGPIIEIGISYTGAESRRITIKTELDYISLPN